ncbi:uncharacterized protein LOC100882345 [Megachile rotundata]|uniref:uncharacterized protein LOC100882345 n=1 Tax=Megachile rotundata TaxID=143995 RepID=UPI003FCFB844
MSKEGNEEGPQGGDAAKKDANADLYENRGTKKIVRLVTVVAYMFSVSFVAIVLSAYYLFLWEPPNPKLIRRPVHLSSEPEVQFLLSDSPDSQNDVPMNNFLSEVTTDHKGSNSSYKLFSGRITGDNNYDGKKHRRTLNESLALLKNSLIEFMRNRVNNSKLDRNVSGKEKRLNSTKKSEEKTRSKNVENERGFQKIVNRTLENSGTFLTLNSSTISGDETNNDRFTSTRNGSVYKNVLGLKNGSTENATVPLEQNKRNVSNSFGAKSTTGTDKKMENSSESLHNVLTFSNSNEEFISTSGTTMFNKFNVLPPMRNKDPEIQENRDDQLVNDRSDSTKNAKHLQQASRSSEKLTNIATELKETQVEKMTIKSMTAEYEGTGSPETATTQRQKNLSTILTEINDTFSNVSSIPVVEDLSTNSSADSKDTFPEKDSTIT